MKVGDVVLILKGTLQGKLGVVKVIYSDIKCSVKTGGRVVEFLMSELKLYSGSTISI